MNTVTQLPAPETLDGFGAELKALPNGQFQAVYDTGTVIAELYLGDEGRANWVAWVDVKPLLQGKGLANAFYDAVEAHTGQTIKPSDNLSPEGYKMWLRRDPEAVADSLHAYRDQLLGMRLSDGQIVDVTHNNASVKKGSTCLPLSRQQLVKLGLIPLDILRAHARITGNPKHLPRSSLDPLI